MSLEKMVSEGCLKLKMIGGYSILKISIVGDGPIDMHWRVVHNQYQSSETVQLIYIHRRVVHKKINIIIFIRGLGECEGVGEDSGTR